MTNAFTIHGNLVEIDGIGVLITGDHGVGKTTLTLTLVRDHAARFIADDAVSVSIISGKLYGWAPAATRGLIAINDDVIDVKQVFDPSLIADSTVIERHIRL